MDAAETSGIEGIIDKYEEEFIAHARKTEGVWGEIGHLAKKVTDCLSWYFKPRTFERWNEGLVYKSLGVALFKKYVPTGGSYWNRKTGIYPLASAKSTEEKKWALVRVNFSTKVTELIHLGVMGSIFGPLLFYSYKHERTGMTALIFGLNLAVNVYPILLQRYNRARAYNAIDALKTS